MPQYALRNVVGMTNEVPVAPNPVHMRWNPHARHDMALIRIERAITHAKKHPDVKFTRDDLARVAELMGYQLKKRPTAPSHE